MGNSRKDKLSRLWFDVVRNGRRDSSEVVIGTVTIGGGNPIAVQSMTDTDTNDIEASFEQIGRIHEAGGRIVRLTTQGMKEADNLGIIAGYSHESYPDAAIVADVHFLPQVADKVAEYADKVRINPGNYNDKGGNFTALLEKCRRRGAAMRIGVNHGSLSERMVDVYGDSPEGMVESAMEFLRTCRENDFDQVVISMKSSNTRVMVHAYRMLVAVMENEGMRYPLHLGVTEAGNGIEGRIKSAVGIGALLADGIGDTIRVSLTEAPENEIPVALALARHFSEDREKPNLKPDLYGLYDPFEYHRRESIPTGGIGGNNLPVLFSELEEEGLAAIDSDSAVILTAKSDDPVTEWRNSIYNMDSACDRRPVILHKRYSEDNIESLAIKAAADFGVMFIDGLADGIYIENAGIDNGTTDQISLDILQASRARMSKTEFIACPGCGRTLYALHDTLAEVKSRLSHLKGLKIGVMGCIVNGPGEMADADYGYVGAGHGRITLYRGKEPIIKNIPQSEALDALIGLIKSDGRWIEPTQR